MSGLLEYVCVSATPDVYQHHLLHGSTSAICCNQLLLACKPLLHVSQPAAQQCCSTADLVPRVHLSSINHGPRGPHLHPLLIMSYLVLQFGLVHISAGDLLRAEVAAGTPAGKEAASYMDSGNLVPNSVVVEMVVNRLEQPDVQEHGWLLDGYPRSGDQAEAIVQKGIKPDLFVLISVSLYTADMLPLLVQLL